ncbi:MAG: ribosome-associated protein [Acidobacteriota bacterium]|jgi:ribosome-associated protein|nr:ribosome-associated protein [Acidobacteriota bacterium]
MPESRERTEKGREPQSDAPHDASAAGAEELDERITLALHAAGEKKAHDLVVLDLREVASFTDYFIITSGTNVRQVQAVADEVQEQLRKRLGVKPARVEGYNSAEWILLDYGDFIFHVFEEKSRRFYDLERLWRDAVRVRLPPEQASGEGASRDAR